jgi:HSP20 family molecular chaperone IbpA
MPKVKSEKRGAMAEEKGSAENGGEKKSGWSGGQLFGSETTETTFQGAGFKDKEKALETMQLLEGRDITFQFQVINSMFHRAKVIHKRTKDPEKVRNLTEAIETFEKWLNNYRSHSRAKENLTYLPLEVVEAFQPLADRYGVKTEVPGVEATFLKVYHEVDGDLKKLRVLKVNPDDEKSITWDVHRNKHLKPLVERMKGEEALPLYRTEEKWRGLPTKEHLELVMWGYSPEVTKLKKSIPLLKDLKGLFPVE